MKDFLQKIGTKIRVLRQAKGYTQETIADLLNMSVSAYSKIEQGKTNIGLLKLEEISKVFEISSADLLSFDENNIFLLTRSQGNAIQNTNATINLYANKEEVDSLKYRLEKAETKVQKLETEIQDLKQLLDKRN